MKKILFIVSFTVLFLTSIAVSFAKTSAIVEKPELKVIVDGKQQILNNTPINYNGRVLLGLRELLVSIGVPDDDACIKWNPQDKSINIFYYDKDISLSIGNKNAMVNGKSVQIDAEPVIYKNRTYIPARFIAQSLEKLVFWDGKTGSVVICEEDTFNQVSHIFNTGMVITKPLRRINTETFKVDGSQTYSSKKDIIADPKKKIQYTVLTSEKDGQYQTTEYYEDEKYEYIKPSYKDKWLKKPVVIPDNILGSDEAFKAFVGSFVIKKSDENTIILEGDNFSLISDTIGTSIDITKDKTSRCHVIMEYGVYSDGVKKEYFRRKREIKATGQIVSGSQKKSYENIMITEDSIEEMASVKIPDDLKNSYTLPEGFDEYYGIGVGLSFIVPKSWTLPNVYDESPFMYYENEKDPKKWCGIIVERVYDFDTSMKMDDLRKHMGEGMKASFKDGKVIKSENIKWKNYNACRIIITGTDNKTGQSLKVQLIVVYYKGTVLIFTHNGEASTFDARLKEAEAIMNSLVDIPPMG